MFEKLKELWNKYWEWIEADLSGDSIYYYNGAASREVGSID